MQKLKFSKTRAEDSYGNRYAIVFAGDNPEPVYMMERMADTWHYYPWDRPSELIECGSSLADCRAAIRRNWAERQEK